MLQKTAEMYEQDKKELKYEVQKCTHQEKNPDLFDATFTVNDVSYASLAFSFFNLAVDALRRHRPSLPIPIQV